MISADVKANIKQQELKDLVGVSYKFLLEVPSKLEMRWHNGVCFSLAFGWYSIHLDIVR